MYALLSVVERLGAVSNHTRAVHDTAVYSIGWRYFTHPLIATSKHVLGDKLLFYYLESSIILVWIPLLFSLTHAPPLYSLCDPHVSPAVAVVVRVGARMMRTIRAAHTTQTKSLD